MSIASDRGAGVRSVPIAKPSTGEEEWQALRAPLESGWLTQGPRVAEFERAFADRHGVRHGIAVTSCTTGLHMSLMALGVGPGDEVIVPSFTWVATANAVIYCGATPVLVDVDRTTFNLDPAEVRKHVTERTRVVVAVHLFGLCVDVEALGSALPDGITILEDAACAAGAELRGRHAGSMGKVGVFSFHPRKSITTGEGGMVTTDDDDLAARIRQMRDHGATVSEEQRHLGPQPYVLPEFDVLGFNYRMTDLQGAVGIVQLGKLDRFVDERAAGARFYADALAGVGWLRLPAEPENGRHAWQAYVTYVDERAAPAPRNVIMSRLQERGIGTRPGTHAVHMLAYYRQQHGYSAADLPVTRDCTRYTMAIPLHNLMTQEDFEHVARCIQEL